MAWKKGKGCVARASHSRRRFGAAEGRGDCQVCVIGFMGLVAIKAIARNWTVATGRRKSDLLDDSKASSTLPRRRFGGCALSIFCFT